MTEEQLLEAAEFVLVQAVEEAEFTRSPKDLAYAETVANVVERRRAKLWKYDCCDKVTYDLIGGRVHAVVRSLAIAGDRDWCLRLWSGLVAVASALWALTALNFLRLIVVDRMEMYDKKRRSGG
jgi:hypothetical protein